MTKYLKTVHPQKEVLNEVRELLSASLGNLAQPARVVETDLALALGVSRTPVREALIKLGASGFLDHEPGVGAILRPVTNEEYFHWMEFRKLIEVYSAGQAAVEATPEEIKELYKISDINQLKHQNSEERITSYSELNVQFHERLIELSRNPLLVKVWRLMGHRGVTYQHRTISRLNRVGISVKEHKEILDAIRDRNPELARECAAFHVDHLLSDVRKISEQVPDN